MGLAVGSCALILIWLQGVCCRQEFLRQPQYTEVNPGETAQLECSILNKKGDCGWQKDRKPQRLFSGKHEWIGDQAKGDCSLLVANAQIDKDDGEWECQVTESDDNLGDALSSAPARLVVRVAPELPLLKFGQETILLEKNLTVTTDQTETLVCQSLNGNPPAKIRWFIGDEDITQFSTQTNVSESEKSKLWNASSQLNYVFSKKQNKQLLKCQAFHKAYDRNTEDTVATLNIQYVPTVVLSGKPTTDIEDGRDVVRLDCHVDANPPALVFWKKDGRQMTASEILQFNPIHKEDSGIYSCQGQNSLGNSEPAIVHLDVKYRPQDVHVISESENARVYNQTTLKCTADSNPPAHFIWLFSATGDANNAQMKGIDSILHISNVTYSMQGTYVCFATNTIDGEERGTQSDPVQLNVMGVPQILPNISPQNKVLVAKGEDAILDVPFCSDPPPTIITWEWGSLKLAVGEGKGKFIAEQVPLENNKADCYEARLVIQKAEASDARRYTLTIENGSGNDSYVMALDVSEPVSMSAVIGIVIGCLVILVIVILVVLYAFRSEKWCFHKESTFKPTLSGEEGFSKESRHGSSSSFPRAIPPDALYTLPPKRASKFEEDRENENVATNISNDHNENKSSSKVIDTDDEDCRTSDRLPTLSPSHYHSEYSDIRYHPQVQEVADI